MIADLKTEALSPSGIFNQPSEINNPQ